MEREPGGFESNQASSGDREKLEHLSIPFRNRGRMMNYLPGVPDKFRIPRVELVSKFFIQNSGPDL